MTFVKEYNQRTASQEGSIVPVHLTVYEDKSFTFQIKTPPASDLLRKAAKIEKGSGMARTEKVGKLNYSSIQEIAKLKMKDLNASSVEAAAKVIEGTARSMGIEVVGE